jgi:phage terminase small subunit
LTADMVVDELRKIAFANMAGYMKSTPDGYPYLDFSGLTGAQTAALSEVTVDSYFDGAGDDAREVKRVKFKLHDKLGALDKLGRHLGMFVTKHQHDGTIEVVTNVREFIAGRIARLRASRRVRDRIGGDE